MRTKEELANALIARKSGSMLSNSAWGDLVSAISAIPAEKRKELVRMIINKQSKQLSVFLYKLLENNARDRARTYIDSVLADDNISIAELDELIK